MPKLGFCHVVEDWSCRAPASVANSGPVGSCFACGNDVCVNPSCSKVVKWYGYGRRRVCRLCIDEEDRFA